MSEAPSTSTPSGPGDIGRWARERDNESTGNTSSVSSLDSNDSIDFFALSMPEYDTSVDSTFELSERDYSQCQDSDDSEVQKETGAFQVFLSSSQFQFARCRGAYQTN